MTPSMLHKSDEQIKNAVEEELGWLPGLNSTHIGVGVDTGTVTLSGHVDSYPEKLLAAQAAFRVRGVKALAQEITVRSLFSADTDDDIAMAAGRTLERAVLAGDSVQVSVTNHEITLTGEVESILQSEAAGRAMHHINGVTHVLNEIRVHGGVQRSGLRDAMVDGPFAIPDPT